MTPESLIAIALGGGAGALLRFWVVTRFLRRGAWGTFLVNVLGSFLLGALIPSLTSAPAWLQAGLAVGFCGAFTTFSALALEAVLIWRAGHRTAAASYVAGTLFASIAALGLGVWFF